MFSSGNISQIEYFLYTVVGDSITLKVCCGAFLTILFVFTIMYKFTKKLIFYDVLEQATSLTPHLCHDALTNPIKNSL